MSRFFSEKYASLEAYTPGEQPRDMRYVKLNTNESPYPPSKRVLETVAGEAGRLNLYSDPECTELRESLAGLFGVRKENVIVSNGSDEALNFIFMAYGDSAHPFCFPDITYGFYPVFAALNGVPYEEKLLNDDFTVKVEDYVACGKNVVIANPNAPTGISLGLGDIERIASSNPENIVVIDEAYVDFGGGSAIQLTKKYPNLIVTGTFSKSRSMAGARLGFAVADEELMRDLNTIRYSTNPYNVNRMTLAAGAAAVADNDYYMDNCRKIIETREYTAKKLTEMGFSVLPSKANFVFTKSDKISGGELYRELKARGVLVRHFTSPRIAEYNRISIGTREEMDVFLQKTEEILSGVTK